MKKTKPVPNIQSKAEPVELSTDIFEALRQDAEKCGQTPAAQLEILLQIHYNISDLSRTKSAESLSSISENLILGGRKIKGVIVKQTQSERHAHLGIKKGYFVVIDRTFETPTKNGDFVAIVVKTVNSMKLGFYSSLFGIICLESGNDNLPPHFFGIGEIEMFGQIIGYCTGEPSPKGKYKVLPLNNAGAQ